MHFGIGWTRGNCNRAEDLTIMSSFTAASLLMLVQTAQPEHHGGEVNLVVPDLSNAVFLNGISGSNLLLGGLLIAILGMVFGLMIYQKLKNLPVHTSMREISELIYETCKTY